MVSFVFWVVLLIKKNPKRCLEWRVKPANPEIPCSRVWDNGLWLSKDKILGWRETRQPASWLAFPCPWAPPGCGFRLCHQSCLRGDHGQARREKAGFKTTLKWLEWKLDFKRTLPYVPHLYNSRLKILLSSISIFFQLKKF